MKNIIVNEFRKYIRNPFMLIVLILFPIVMIYILGNLVENVQTADETIGKIKVAYTAENVDFGALYQNDKIEFLSVSVQEGPKMLYEDQVDGYFSMGSDGLTLYDGSSVMMNSVIKGLANGFLLQRSVYESIARDNAVSLPTITLHEEDYTSKRKLTASMNMLDYYSIAMIIMTAIYAVMTSSMTFTDERKNKTMNRLITSPMNKGKIFCSICIGQIPFIVLQYVGLLTFSAIFFNAHFAPSLFGKVILFTMIIMTAIVFSILGVMVSLIFRRAMSVTLFIIAWAMLFFSGCFAKAMELHPICNFLPPYIVRQAAFSLNMFEDRGPAIRVILVELVIIVVLILLGGWIFSKKQEERA